jgi:hypothetical protein
MDALREDVGKYKNIMICGALYEAHVLVDQRRDLTFAPSHPSSFFLEHRPAFVWDTSLARALYRPHNKIVLRSRSAASYTFWIARSHC